MTSLPAKMVLCSCFISACSNDPHIKNTSFLVAGNEVKLMQAFNVKALHSHVIFQDGKIIEDNDLSPYRTSCVFDVNDLGPTTYQPQSLQVTKVTYNEEMYSDSGAVVRYFTEFYFTSNNSRMKQSVLTCQVLDDTMQYHPFPTADIKQAIGDYFKL